MNKPPAAEDLYQSPFTARYCRNSKEHLELFSERRKIETWRKLWTWLAEAELSLGLDKIKPEMIDEMKANIGNIDWDLARNEEKRLRHDVMAHIHTFERICPKSAGIIHLGATSAFVQDNADIIMIRDALDLSLPLIATCLASKAGSYVITGQTYTRLMDADLLNSLSLVGAAVQKACMDIRMLQAYGEIQEPFEDSQVVVREEKIEENVREELPFLALEHVLMELTLCGASRQEGHEKIRQVSLAAHERRQKGEEINLTKMLEGDKFFDPVRQKIAEIANDPQKLTGRSSEQVQIFVRDHP